MPFGTLRIAKTLSQMQNDSLDNHIIPPIPCLRRDGSAKTDSSS